ncbi:gliding motility lipoprotein GldD [Spongiimicrobium sp. 3-5]|uniref:gliding motility lipoprotein GldD n=1 Tax=Spongiimicrobium sp. 3-5 TaxID=3332596 RepID=UPI0039815C60
MRNKVILSVLTFTMIVLSCKEETLPKPKAQLRLEYEHPKEGPLEMEDYRFVRNQLSSLKSKNGQSLTLDYPMMNGSIFITYKTVNNNLEKLLSDAQRLSYEHAVKADGILEQPFVNEEDKVYGMLYEVTGNAASQSQFYLTDSISHFVTGSLYFYAKPNYDSIYPAAVYLQRDIRRIMETLRWKENTKP